MCVLYEIKGINVQISRLFSAQLHVQVGCAVFSTIQPWDIPSYSSLFPDVRKVFDSVEDVYPATLTVSAVFRCSVSADKPGTAA